jgi:hypothetical protein
VFAKQRNVVLRISRNKRTISCCRALLDPEQAVLCVRTQRGSEGKVRGGDKGGREVKSDDVEGGRNRSKRICTGNGGQTKKGGTNEEDERRGELEREEELE